MVMFLSQNGEPLNSGGFFDVMGASKICLHTLPYFTMGLHQRPNKCKNTLFNIINNVRMI
ncbi:MAG: hypothetical protein ACI8WT_000385 [Clostridium sp.]|jgi:hypothetical protein